MLIVSYPSGGKNEKELPEGSNMGVKRACATLGGGMKRLVFFATLLVGCCLSDAHATNENWIFLGISSIDISTDYYDANSIKIDSGFFSGPTAKVTVLVVYSDNHPELTSEKAFMQFYCKKKTFLTLERHQLAKNGAIKSITKQSWVQDVPPNTIAEKLFNIVCR